MKKLFLLLLTVMTISLCASAQTRTVTGTVIDAETGETLVGVSVSAGPGIAIATDADGQFSLKVPDSAKELTVSYVGYDTKTVKIGEGNLIIDLSAANSLLDPVIVVAYGEQKKSSFTGSAATVGSATIEKTQVTNVLDALSGKVAGLQLSNASGAPGSSSPTIRIRGFSSINAGNAPLVIVDGTPYTGDINSLNTNDIESMSVLKDAASNALYGARGANGVILITTKRARLGEANVTVDAKWGANTRATQDYNYITDPGQYYETYYRALNLYATMPTNLKNDAGANAGGLGYTAAQANQWANSVMTGSTAYGLGYNVFTVPEGQYLIGQNGKLNPNATVGRLATYNGQEFWLQPDNWMDATYKTSLRQEYNVTVTQGTEKSNFYASVSYLDNDGIVCTPSYFRRFTGRLSADVQAKSWLKVGANLSYGHINLRSMDGEEGASNSSSNLFAFATQLAPIYPVFMRDGQGNIMLDSRDFPRYDYGAGLNAGSKRPFLSDANPISQELLDLNKTTANTFTGTGFVEIRFLKDFKFTSNNNVNLLESRGTAVTNPYYGQYASMNGIVYKAHSRATDYTFQQLLNWNHKFNNLHDVTVLVGHEYYKTITESLSASRSNMFDPSNDELAGAITDGSSSSSTSVYNNEGWLGRAQYDYDGKYFGSASFRRDASSRFDPKHRWGSFWSVGAAWIMTKESWFTDAIWLNMLKLKASYGEQGNDNIGNYLYTNTYSIINSAGHPAAEPATMGNPDITWEKNGNFNAGVEFAMFGNRFSGGIDAFWRKTSDMLMYFPLPASFGFMGYYDNVGDMTNTGVEIELSGTPIQTKDFTWTIDANLTWYKNKISRLPDERKGMTIKGHGGYSSGNYYYGEGLPMYTFRMPEFAGVDPETGMSLYNVYKTSEDGSIVYDEVDHTTNVYSEATSVTAGTALAPVYGGFSTTFSYKGFDLSASFNYQIGGQVYDSGYSQLMTSPYSGSRGVNYHADILDAWTPENKYSSIPRFMYNDQTTTSTSTRFLTNASYLSLENINFGYQLPTKVVKKMFLTKLRFYFACDNVWVWSRRQGLDPRQSFTGGSNNTYYAPIRAISGGFNVSF